MMLCCHMLSKGVTGEIDIGQSISDILLAWVARIFNLQISVS